MTDMRNGLDVNMRVELKACDELVKNCDASIFVELVKEFVVDKGYDNEKVINLASVGLMERLASYDYAYYGRFESSKKADGFLMILCWYYGDTNADSMNYYICGKKLDNFSIKCAARVVSAEVTDEVDWLELFNEINCGKMKSKSKFTDKYRRDMQEKINEAYNLALRDCSKTQQM